VVELADIGTLVPGGNAVLVQTQPSRFLKERDSMLKKELQVSVPVVKCINNCKFCVAKMHSNPYESRWGLNVDDWFGKDYKRRMSFARDIGCNVLVLTGIGEPLQNRGFLTIIMEINDLLHSPFSWVELQTTGVLLNREMLYWLRKINVSVIRLSISDLFDEGRNQEIVGIPKKLRFDKIESLCYAIKEQGFNLQLDLNLTYTFDSYSVKQILAKCKELGADTVLFRELYSDSGKNHTKQGIWVAKNSIDNDTLSAIDTFIFESKRAGINSDIRFDQNCMEPEEEGKLKRLILQVDGRLYKRWEDPKSLIF